MEYSREIELKGGHIIDSGIMTQVFDAIMEMGGAISRSRSLKSGKKTG